jgi:hypothetical protein
MIYKKIFSVYSSYYEREIKRERKFCLLFAKTHQILSHHIALHVKDQLNYSFHPSLFAWANMKPDFVPHLAIRKHYIEESFDFVVDKILALTQLPQYELLNEKRRKNIEEEIGVICHFLSDFFCVPHNQRWEFKHSMLPHIQYESKLETIAKEVSVIDKIHLPAIYDSSRNSVVQFLRELLAEYECKQDYVRDLIYSVNVCSSITSFILSAILANTNTKKETQVA